MHYILETERLLLRPFAITDTKFVIELVNSPGWLAFIGDRNIKTEEQAKDYLKNGPLKSYEVNGFGLYLVEIKTGNIPAGMCGIIKRDYLEHPDIGFAFLPEFTGKGLAFEAAKATLAFARDRLKLPVIFAITIPDNERSINLLEKTGLAFHKTIDGPDTGEQLMLFST